MLKKRSLCKKTLLNSNSLSKDVKNLWVIDNSWLIQESPDLFLKFCRSQNFFFFFLCKKPAFLVKNSTFTQSNSMRDVLERFFSSAFSFC